MAVGAWAEVAVGRRFWGEVLRGLLIGVQWGKVAERICRLLPSSQLPLSLKIKWPVGPQRTGLAPGPRLLLCWWLKPWPGPRKRCGNLRLAPVSPIQM